MLRFLLEEPEFSEEPLSVIKTKETYEAEKINESEKNDDSPRRQDKSYKLLAKKLTVKREELLAWESPRINLKSNV